MVILMVILLYVYHKLNASDFVGKDNFVELLDNDDLDNKLKDAFHEKKNREKVKEKNKYIFFFLFHF